MEVFQHRCWLGHGSYGDVQLCEVSPQTAAMLLAEDQEKSVGPTLIALKTWKQAHKDGKVMRIALREVQILKVVNHPNIIRLKCAFRTPSGRVCMAFEYGGKSAHQLLESRFHCGIPGPLLQRPALQLVHALRYLHSQKIIHRDVKPANVLVDAGGLLRLCDFGFSRYIAEVAAEARGGSGCVSGDADGGAGGGGEPLTPYVITRWYRAPEVLLGMPYGTPTDVWSLGCTLAELATGEPLLPGQSSLDQLGRIVRLLGPMPTHMDARAVYGALRGDAAAPPLVERPPGGALRRQLENRLDPELLDLVAACLRIDPRDRPTVDELLQMPYCVDAARLFEGTSLGRVYGASGAAAWAGSSTSSSSSSPSRHAGASAAPPTRFPAPPPSGAGGTPRAACQHHRRLQRPEHSAQGRAHPLHQHQLSCAESRVRDVFSGAGGGLPYSCSGAAAVVSSVLRASASASASCSFLSASGAATASTCTLTASRSMTSAVADSLYGSTVALSCSCASADCCPAGAGGGTRGDVDADGEGCAAADLLLVSDAVSAVSPAPAAAVAAASRPPPVVGAAASEGAAPPRRCGAGGCMAACWHATAAAAGAAPIACVGGAAVGGGDEGGDGAHPTAAPPGGGGGGGGDGYAYAPVPRLIGAEPSELGAWTAAPTVAGCSASWPAPPQQSGFSREAAIRALAAAATFATGQAAPTSAAAAAANAAAAGRAAANAAAATAVRAGVSARRGTDARAAGAGITSSPPPAQTPAPGATGATGASLVRSGSGRSPPQHSSSCGDVRRAPADVRVVPGVRHPMEVVSVDVFGVGSSGSGSAARFSSSSGTGSQVFCSPKCPTPLASSDLGPSAASTAPPANARAAASAAAAGAATAGPGPAAVEAAASSTNTNGAWVATAPRRPWRAARSGDDDGTDGDGRSSDFGGSGSGCGGAARPMLESWAAPPPAALSPSSRWLDAFYHQCSPPVTSSAAAAAAGALAAARLTSTSATTTMSFNWHNAESPSGDGDGDGGVYGLGGGGGGGDSDATQEEPTLRCPPAAASQGPAAQPQQPPSHHHHHQPQQQRQQEDAYTEQEQRQWKQQQQQQHSPHLLLWPGQQPVEQRRQHPARYVLGGHWRAQGDDGAQLVAGSPPPMARCEQQEDPPLPQRQQASQQLEQPPLPEDATEDDAELALVSGGVLSPGANALFPPAARAGSRRRPRAAALPGADADPDGAAGAGGVDDPEGSGGSESDSDPEGCRPCDLTYTQSALRKGYASAPGCGGSGGGSTGSGAATAVSSTVVRGTTAPRTAIPRSRPAAAAAGSRQPLHAVLPYNGWGVYGTGFAPATASDHGAAGTEAPSGASGPFTEAGKPRTVAAGAEPAVAIPPAAVAAATAAAKAARSAIAASERRCSMTSSLDSTSRPTSFCTSFGERGAGGSSGAGGGGGGGGDDDSSGGHRRVKGWLRKSRVWLKRMLEGASSASASQRQV